MRSVGVGLAFVAMAVMTSAPALAAGKNKKKVADAPPAAAAPAAPTATDATPAPAAATEVKAAPATDTKAADAKPAAGSVTVHLDSSQTVSLERRTGGDAWEHVCNSPCDTSVSVSDEYRVVGTDLNASKGFMIDGSGGDKVTLNVTPGSQKKFTTGMWLVGGGAVLGLGGAITILAGASNHAVPGNDGSLTTNKNTNIISVGTALIVAGVVTAVVGGAMAVDNAHTQVGGGVASPAEKRDDKDKKGLGVQVTASRTPTWHQETGPTMAQATVVPFLSGSF